MLTHLSHDDKMTMANPFSHTSLIPEYSKGFSEYSPFLNKQTNPEHTH